MWCQYGDRHAGVCLVLSKERLEEWIENTNLIPKKNFGNVEYTDNLRLPNIKGLEFDDSIKGSVHQYVKDNFNDLFFRKHLDYLDESEYRIVVESLDTQPYIDLSKCIKGFILGCNTATKVYKDILLKIAEKYKIEPGRLHYHEGKFLLGSLSPCNNF